MFGSASDFNDSHEAGDEASVAESASAASIETSRSPNHRNAKYPNLFPAVYHSLSISRVGGQRTLPADKPVGPPPGGISNSVMVPSGVTRPSVPAFVNRIFRSGPTAMLIGDPFALGIGNSV